MPRKHDPYKNIAGEYDKLIGPRDEVKYLLKLIPKSHPYAKTILEIACGTGTLLKHFASSYQVSGIDISHEMLKKAKDTIPSGKFYHGNMTSFKLKKKFDIVACLFNSMNHLRNFKEWQLTFKKSLQHLNKNGVFIFDVMTPLGLKNYASDPDKIARSDSKIMTTEYSLLKDGAFQMRASIFTHQKGSLYSLKETKIIERAFESVRIISELKKYFTTVKVIDPDRKKPLKNSEVLYFIARV
jgi:SAM-dependent methyltransferase